MTSALAQLHNLSTSSPSHLFTITKLCLYTIHRLRPPLLGYTHRYTHQYYAPVDNSRPSRVPARSTLLTPKPKSRKLAIESGSSSGRYIRPQTTIESTCFGASVCCRRKDTSSFHSHTCRHHERRNNSSTSLVATAHSSGSQTRRWLPLIPPLRA